MSADTPEVRVPDERKSDCRPDVTQTPSFQTWFRGSKVVDSNGEPQVVYHGTEAIRVAENMGVENEFDASIKRFYSQSYFSANPAEAQSYAMSSQQTYPVYLSLKKPYETTNYDEFAEAYAGPADALEKQGYDGVVYRVPGEAPQFLAFRPEQIKSAIGNNGSFDPNDPDITHSRTPGAKPDYQADGMSWPLACYLDSEDEDLAPECHMSRPRCG